MPPVKVAVSKESPDDKVGVIFMQDDDDRILVHSIKPNSLFANTHLQVGMEVLSINDVATKGLNFGKAMRRLREAEDAIVIVAQEASSALKEDYVLEINEIAPEIAPKMEPPAGAAAAEAPPVSEDPFAAVPPPSYDSEPMDFPSHDSFPVVVPDDKIMPGGAIESISSISDEKPATTPSARRSADPEEISTGELECMHQEATLVVPPSPPRRAADPEENSTGEAMYRHQEATLIMLPEDRPTVSPLRKPDPDGRREATPRLIPARGLLEKSTEHTTRTSNASTRRVPSVAATPVWEESTMEATSAMEEQQHQHNNNYVEEEKEECDIEDTSALEWDDAGPRDVVSIESPPDVSLLQMDHSKGAMVDQQQHQPGLVTATAKKPTQHAPVGIGLREKQGVGIIIDHIRGDSMFKTTGLQEGMKMLSVNGHDCSQTSKVEAVGLLMTCVGNITIVAMELDGGSIDTLEMTQVGMKKASKTTIQTPELVKHTGTGLPKSPVFIPTSHGGSIVSTSITKPTANSKVGLSVANQIMNGRTVPIILAITKDGLCANTPLQKDMAIICIGGVHCRSRDDVISMLKVGTGRILIVAGPAHVVAVTVIKPRRDSRVGISLRRQAGVGLVVDSISPNGLFAKSMELKQGMKIILINGGSTEHLESSEVIAIISNAEKNVTIVADPMTNTNTPTPTQPNATNTPQHNNTRSAPPMEAAMRVTSLVASSRPPSGAPAGGEWGTGGAGTKVGLCSCFGKADTTVVALYKDPNGRVYDTKGQYAGSVSTTNWTKKAGT